LVDFSEISKWKLDDDLYKNLAKMIFDIYEESRDQTNLIGFYRTVDSFFITVHSLLHRESREGIYNQMEEIKKLMEEIHKKESVVNEEHPLQDIRDEDNRTEAWNMLRQVNMDIHSSLVDQGVYGERKAHFGSKDAMAEMGD